ncbi:unnamed protein product [Euphydryas editha]|uniref:Uncharacterized protein n=1 Tax=Euphydryas editha TaxID=104508 RepID=A0AAU9UTL1_EUPED|nr:unnamed protein product [Euphydryas editha]
MKFLEPGHSFLPNDSDFAKIETRLKQHQRVYVVEDYIEITKKCKRVNPLKIIRMKPDDFLSSKMLEKQIVNRKTYVNKNKVSWLSAKEILLKKEKEHSLFMRSGLNGELQEFDITKKSVRNQSITPSDRVCHACWLRTKIDAVRINSQDDNRQPLIDITDNEQQEQYLPTPTEIPQSESTSTVETQRIVLPDYRRAANSTHSCVFPNCSSNILHNISDKLRATILHNYKFYLPKLARVCSEHLSINIWDT